MRRTRNNHIGNMIKGMLSNICHYENKTSAMIEDEIGQQLGRRYKTIQNYKSGFIPSDYEIIRCLAEVAVKRAFLNYAWVREFLGEAKYPHQEQDALLTHLFPNATTSTPILHPDNNLLAPPFHRFIPREQPFAEIIEGLQQYSAVVLIVGLGGMGKTSLAYEVATQCLQGNKDFPSFDAVVWVSDKEEPGSTTLPVVLNKIAQTLGYSGYDSLELQEKQRKVEDILRRRRVLLVMDNIETITDSVLFSWFIRFPENSKVLATSRELSRSLRNNTWTVELHGMTEDEAYQFAQYRLRWLRLEHRGRTEMMPLIIATGFCPKAIEMGIGLIKQERRSIQVVVDDMYAARGDVFPMLFSRAWALLDEAARRVLLAMPLFRFSASHDALAFTVDVLGIAFDRAIERLTDLALLDEQRTNLHTAPRYSIHPLVQAFVRAKLNEYADFEHAARERWVQWYVSFTTQIGFAYADTSKLQNLDSEHETVYEVLKWATEHQRYDDVIQLANGIEYYYYVRTLWDRKATTHLLHAEAARHCSNWAEELTALSLLIQLASRQGRKSEIERYLPRLLELAELNKPSGKLFFFFHHALALSKVAMLDFTTAQQEWNTILESGMDLPSHMYIGARQWIATCLYHQRCFSTARQLYQEVLEESQRIAYGRYTLLCQLKLTMIDVEQGKVDGATESIVNIRNKAQENQDWELLAHTQYAWSHICELKDKRNEAHRALTESIAFFERMGLGYELLMARKALARIESSVHDNEKHIRNS